MNVHRSHTRGAASVLLALAVASACASPSARRSDHRVTSTGLPVVASRVAETPGDDALLEVRQATRRFRDFEVALDEGWSRQVTECMTSERGGQGFHYGNPDLIEDGGALDALRPELLMYEPGEDGEMELVGIEYIVPEADWTSAEPPRLLGQDLHVNETYGIWVLHVWWRDNPLGIFADWNPAVSCPPAS